MAIANGTFDTIRDAYNKRNADKRNAEAGYQMDGAGNIVPPKKAAASKPNAPNTTKSDPSADFQMRPYDSKAGRPAVNIDPKLWTKKAIAKAQDTSDDPRHQAWKDQQTTSSDVTTDGYQRRSRPKSATVPAATTAPMAPRARPPTDKRGYNDKDRSVVAKGRAQMANLESREASFKQYQRAIAPAPETVQGLQINKPEFMRPRPSPMTASAPKIADKPAAPKPQTIQGQQINRPEFMQGGSATETASKAPQSPAGAPPRPAATATVAKPSLVSRAADWMFGGAKEQAAGALKKASSATGSFMRNLPADREDPAQKKPKKAVAGR